MQHTQDILLYALILTPLLTNGVYTVSQPAMILHPLRQMALRLGYWGNPVALCPVCMAGSVYNVVTVLALVILLNAQLSWPVLAVIVLNGLVSAYTVQIASELLELLRLQVDRMAETAQDRRSQQERDRCLQDPDCTCVDCAEHNERNTVKGTPYETPSSAPQAID